jgi:hypothetical protein
VLAHFEEAEVLEILCCALPHIKPHIKPHIENHIKPHIKPHSHATDARVVSPGFGA